MDGALINGAGRRIAFDIGKDRVEDRSAGEDRLDAIDKAGALHAGVADDQHARAAEGLDELRQPGDRAIAEFDLRRDVVGECTHGSFFQDN